MDIDVGRVVEQASELVRLLGREGPWARCGRRTTCTLGEKLALKLLTQAPSPEEDVENPATAAARFQFEAQVCFAR